MNEYSAKIKHSEETIMEMARAQYTHFKPGYYNWMTVIALAMLAASIFVPEMSQVLRGMLVACGCFIIMGLRMPPRQLAKQVIASLGGKFPEMYYFFYDKNIKLTGADNAEQSYGGIVKLAEDRNYIYMFLENHTAYMIDKKSVKPELDGFRKMLSLKTGCDWSRPGRVNVMELLKFERVKTRL